MSGEVIAGITAIVTTGVTGAFKLAEIWWTKKVATDKKAKYNISTIVDCDYQIDKLLWEALQMCKADRVFIARFHNGGSYSNGVPMEKISMTNEVYDSTSTSIIGQFHQRLISEFGAIVQPLVFEGIYEQSDVEQIRQPVLKSVCQKLTNKAMSLILIRDTKQRPTAFMCICWNSENAYTTNDRQKVELMQILAQVSPLLNIENASQS